MQTLSRRNMLSLAAGAAVAASTGAAIAFPAPSEFDRLLNAYKAAFAEYDRLLHLSGDKEQAHQDWVKNLPETDRYFTTAAFVDVRTGKAFILKIDMTEGLESGLRRINAQHSDYATGFFGLGLETEADFKKAADRFYAARPAHLAKLEAIKADVRKAFTAAFEPIGKQIAALDYSAEEAACDAAATVETGARLAVLAYRPVNDSERAAKGAWLFSQFGTGDMFALNEAEGEALLTSLYPANA